MVCFHDNPEKYNNPAMLHKIDQEVRKSGFSVLMSSYEAHMNSIRAKVGNHFTHEVFFPFADVEMYRAG